MSLCFCSVCVSFVQLEDLRRADRSSNDSYRIKKLKIYQGPTKGLYINNNNNNNNNKYVALVRERILTERPPLVGEVSANSSG
jgi:hypothetical protein